MKLVIRAKDIIWDSQNIEHIAGHNLKPGQVMQVFSDFQFIDKAQKDSYGKQRYAIYGRCGRRLVFTVIVVEGSKYRVITARDMAKDERQHYRSKYEKNKKDT